VSADQRVTMARGYLASVRQHKVSGLPPSVLVRECAELRRQLGQVLDAIDQAAELEDLADFPAEEEPYCMTCGEWAGMFLGMDGWHHFRGDPGAGGVREIFDADHEAVIGWRFP
jgi:hypothetical protein